MTIFKSRQVNLDPEPWINPKTSTRYPAEGGLLRDYLPRSEFEPTRDPYPWEHEGGARGANDGTVYGKSWRWAPRREQFDAPVNWVLVAFRERQAGKGNYKDALDWLERFSETTLAAYSEIEHARKVLTRLAAF